MSYFPLNEFPVLIQNVVLVVFNLVKVAHVGLLLNFSRLFTLLAENAAVKDLEPYQGIVVHGSIVGLMANFNFVVPFVVSYNQHALAVELDTVVLVTFS